MFCTHSNAYFAGWLCTASCSSVGASSPVDAAFDATTSSATDTAIDSSLDGFAIDVTEVSADSSAIGTPADAGVAHLAGAFLLVDNSYSASFFRQAVDEMAALGMTSVWVQTESYLDSTFARNAVDPALIQAVLDEARTKHMQVHIGLALPEVGNGDPSYATNSAWISSLISADKSSFDGLWSSYASYVNDGTWKAVYLPVELWTPANATDLGQLPSYVTSVAGYVKSKSSLLVSMSPFISSMATDGGMATKTAFSSLFASAPVDVVALQDGVGARGLAVAQIAENAPYFSAMIAACAAKCSVWANVEAFAGSEPATWTRVGAQIADVSALTPSMITYEYSTDWFAAGPGGAAAGALHDAYAAYLAGGD